MITQVITNSDAQLINLSNVHSQLLIRTFIMPNHQPSDNEFTIISDLCLSGLLAVPCQYVMREDECLIVLMTILTTLYIRQFFF